MDAYIFQAALYCARCARLKALALSAAARLSKDSDRYPQGPYPNGGGEADSPQHCDSCNAFLENPLTSDGYEYTKQALAEGAEVRKRLAEAERIGQGEVQRRILAIHEEWQRFYEIIV